MASIIDSEFGEITIRRITATRHVRIRVANDGRYVATAPAYTPIYFIKRMVETSREELRRLASHTSIASPYVDGQWIGKSHQLVVVPTSMVSTPTISVKKQKIIAQLPPAASLSETPVQQQIRDTVIRVLRKEAKAYLPKRLKYLADQYGFSYEKVRFSHSSGRWGSCSSAGTISLNIALMKLPHELIDYVLIHELCHTRQMNHSDAFWGEVAAYDPHFKLHRRSLKKESPSV
jgi:hypothetical protein